MLIDERKQDLLDQGKDD